MQGYFGYAIGDRLLDDLKRRYNLAKEFVLFINS